VALHHPTSPTCASRSPPCQHDDRSALLLMVTSWCQECESSLAIGHSQSLAQKRGTACQSTSSHLTLSLSARTVSRHICLNCHTASRSDDFFDVDRRPCSDSRHVTTPYKSALYYYYYYYSLLMLKCRHYTSVNIITVVVFHLTNKQITFTTDAFYV